MTQVARQRCNIRHGPLRNPRSKNHRHRLSCLFAPRFPLTSRPIYDLRLMPASRRPNPESCPNSFISMFRRSDLDRLPFPATPALDPLARRNAKSAKNFSLSLTPQRRERSTASRPIVFNQSWWEGTAGNSHRESCAAGSRVGAVRGCSSTRRILEARRGPVSISRHERRGSPQQDSPVYAHRSAHVHMCACTCVAYKSLAGRAISPCRAEGLPRGRAASLLMPAAMRGTRHRSRGVGRQE